MDDERLLGGGSTAEDSASRGDLKSSSAVASSQAYRTSHSGRTRTLTVEEAHSEWLCFSGNEGCRFGDVFKWSEWWGLQLVDKPAILGLGIVIFFLAGLEYSKLNSGPADTSEDRIPRGSLHALTHMIITTYIMFCWRIMAPDIWTRSSSFYKHTAAFAIVRGVVIFSKELLLVRTLPEQLLGIILELIAVVTCNWGIPSYLYFRAYDYYPTCSKRDFFAVLTICNIVSQLSVSGVSHERTLYDVTTFACGAITFILSMSIVIYHIQTKTTPTQSSRYSIIVLTITMASYGVFAIISTVRYIRLALADNYHPTAGLFLFYVITTIVIQTMWELVSIFDSREEISLVFLSVVFFQEFSVGVVFVDADLDWEFMFLVLIVLCYDYMTASGLGYEIYYNLFKDMSSIQGKPMYMAKKYFYMRIKCFCENTALFAILLMVAIEIPLSKLMGYALITMHKEENFGRDSEGSSKDIIITLSILIITAMPLGSVASYMFDVRMQRIRTKAFEQHTLTQEQVYSTALDPESSQIRNAQVSPVEPFSQLHDDAIPRSSSVSKGRIAAEESDNFDPNPEEKIPELPRDFEEKYTNTDESKAIARMDMPGFVKVHPILDPTRKVSFSEWLLRNKKHRGIRIIGAAMAMAAGFRWFEPAYRRTEVSSQGS